MSTITTEARPRPVEITLIGAKDAFNNSIDDISQGQSDVSSFLAVKKRFKDLSNYITLQLLKKDASRRPRISTTRQTAAISPNTTTPLPVIAHIESREVALPERPDNLPVVAECSIVEVATSQKGGSVPFVSTDVTTPEREITSLPVTTHPVLPEFDQIDEGLYQAIRIAVPRIYLSKWEESWKEIIKGRLVKLGLENSISGLSLCMVGKTADSHGMEATIVVYCGSANKKKIVKDLAPFVRSYVKPPPVGLRVIAEDILFSSGDSINSSELVPHEISGMFVMITESVPGLVSETQSLMGITMRANEPIGPSGLPIQHSLCTIGGVIKVGDDILALSVAHSLWATHEDLPSPNQVHNVFCGKVKSAQWSNNQEALLASSSTGRSQDWMTVELDRKYYLPNQFQAEGCSDLIPIHEFLNTQDILDGNVWVCGGISGVQAGWISTTPTTIIYGKAEYSVVTIALLRPLCKFYLANVYCRKLADQMKLAAGDSGSWVIQDNKLCGYILARLNNRQWAYMLPIQSVFDDIERYLFDTTGSRVKVTLPTAPEVHFAQTRSTTPNKKTSQDRLLELQPIELQSDQQILAARHDHQLELAMECDMLNASAMQPITQASRDSLEISTATFGTVNDPKVEDRNLSRSLGRPKWSSEASWVDANQPTEKFIPPPDLEMLSPSFAVQISSDLNTVVSTKERPTFDVEPESERLPRVRINIPARTLTMLILYWAADHLVLLFFLLIAGVWLTIVLVLVLVVLPRKSLSQGEIAAIIVGITIFILLGILMPCCCFTRRRRV